MKNVTTAVPRHQQMIGKNEKCNCFVPRLPVPRRDRPPGSVTVMAIARQGKSDRAMAPGHGNR